MNVAAQLQQIFIFVDELSLEAPIQHMSMTPMTTIVINRVGRIEGLHKLGKIPLWRFQQKIEMIGHQTKEVDPNLKISCPLFQTSQESLSLLLTHPFKCTPRREAD